MEVRIAPVGRRVERPGFVWFGFVAALITGVTALPVGIMFIVDPTGASIGLPAGWIEATPFGSYLVPGLYLFAMNGVGMLALAGLVVLRHWTAPWLMAVLAVGLIIWILVQLAVMPETMILQPIYLATGVLMGLVALVWLRRTGQLVLW